LNLDIGSVTTNWTDLFLNTNRGICRSLLSTTLFPNRSDRIVKQRRRNRREERSKYKAQAHAKSTCLISTKHFTLSRPLYALTPLASCFHSSVLFFSHPPSLKFVPPDTRLTFGPCSPWCSGEGTYRVFLQNIISIPTDSGKEESMQARREKKNTYNQTSRLENPEELKLHHNHEKFLYLTVLSLFEQ
jgi:hypothetical protein